MRWELDTTGLNPQARGETDRDGTQWRAAAHSGCTYHCVGQMGSTGDPRSRGLPVPIVFDATLTGPLNHDVVVTITAMQGERCVEISYVVQCWEYSRELLAMLTEGEAAIRHLLSHPLGQPNPLRSGGSWKLIPSGPGSSVPRRS